MASNDLLSVIIPARNENFLNKTVEDLLNKARGEIEIIPVLDGYWPVPHMTDHWKTPAVIEDKRVHYIHKGKAEGMRAAINSGAAIAKGKYIMKLDAHCMFAEGFDETLKADAQYGLVVIPRRYSLDAETWQKDDSRSIRDYHYLCYPDPNKAHDGGMHGVEWPERTKERTDSRYDVDDTPSFQGSCWFMNKDWFDGFLHGMDEDPIYAGWAQEPTEICLKTWLGGGEVKINKKTWYAHLHKGKQYGRGYPMNDPGVVAGHNYAADYWMNNRWPERKHDIEWFVDEKFSGMPTWPVNWKELYYGKS